MSLEDPRGGHTVKDDGIEQDTQTTQHTHKRQTSSRKVARILIFLIVIILIAAALAYSSLERAGEKGPPAIRKTAIPTATPTAIVPTPTQALFYETFLDNRNSWALSNHGGFFREIINSELVLTNTNALSTLVESLPNDVKYDNFTLTITFALVQGDANDSIGLYIRGDSNLDHDYRIELSGDDTFDFAKEYLDSQSQPQALTLDGPEHLSGLRPHGQLNTMIIAAQGSNMTVTFNDTLVSTVSDNDYASGQIALFVRHGSTSPATTMSIGAIEIDGLS